MAVIDPYPTLELGGAPPTHYRRHTPDWAPVTVKHEYEDAGISTNTTGDIPLRKWTLRYTGLTPTEADIIEGHAEDAEGENHTFTFTDKEGVVHTGVRYESFERTHDNHLSDIVSIDVVLVKYPA